VPRAILVSVQLPSVDDVAHAASIEELGRLVKTLGYEVAGTMTQKRDGIDGGTVLGKGRLAELAAITGGTGIVGSMAIPQKSKARERFENADEKKPEAPQVEPDPDAPPKPEFVIVDHEISPSQARNLERATGAQVLDRTGVIVEIFHRHAHSREARLQVEIARLKYVSPRLRESSAGGGRKRGSGAGESDLDLDRRKIRDRLAELKEQLEDIQRDNDQRRSARRDLLRVALIGYTNAGKSSLMQALTGTEVLVAYKLFATLDTTVRALQPETQPGCSSRTRSGSSRSCRTPVASGWSGRRVGLAPTGKRRLVTAHANSGRSGGRRRHPACGDDWSWRSQSRPPVATSPLPASELTAASRRMARRPHSR
jgi:GTPase